MLEDVPKLPGLTPLVGKTSSGRIPIETLLAFKFEIPDPFDAMRRPFTDRYVKVPTEVMFG
jgi:hypothetical protein